MKNKFMTKALAVVLSASMALSLSSATALTANGAAAPKLTKKSVTLEIGKKAKNKLAKASFKAGWRITKASVKKTAVAKAKVKKNKKVVVVTGVTAGSTKAVLKLKNAKTAATKKLTFKVKVKEAPTPVEPVAEVASIIDAKQTKSNEAEITLDKELEAVPSGEVFRVYLDGADYPLQQINFGADKKTLVVTFDFAASTDAKTYTYTFKTTDGSIKGEKSITTASYAVAKIVADAEQTVPAGKLSPVKFSLVSAAGIDVTNAGDNLDNTIVSFEGQIEQELPTSRNPQILLSNIGDKAEMTVHYNKDTTVEDVKVSITAVAATATEGTMMKFTSNVHNAWLYSEEIKDAAVEVDGTAKINFWVKMDDASKALTYSAVKYDEIAVSSSDDEILTASADQTSGKYAVIEINGVKTGSASVLVKCTELLSGGAQTLEKTFTIPVTVTAKNNDMTAFSTNKSSVALTNAWDTEYFEEVGLNAVNSNDKIVDATFTYEITDTKGKPSSEIWIDEDPDSVYGQDKNANKIKVYAQGAKAGSYLIKITAEGATAGGKESITKPRTISVKVSDVVSEFAKANVTYKQEIDLSQATIGIKNKDWIANSSAVRLKIYANSKFAGYARYVVTTNYVTCDPDGSNPVDHELAVNDWTVGDYNDIVTSNVANARSRIATFVDVADKAGLTNAMGFYVKKSETAYYESDNNVLNLNQKSVKEPTARLGLRKNTRDLFEIVLTRKAPANIFFFGTASKVEGLAEAGKYSVVWYKDGYKSGTKPSIAAKAVTVSYDITAPVIDYDRTDNADAYATPSTWLLEDGDADYNALRFAYSTGKEDTSTYANVYQTAKTKTNTAVADSFNVLDWTRGTTNSFAQGNKVFATAVPVSTTFGVINYVVENTNTITQ